jgi:aminobenzoyl-glutamate utilization protein B
MRTEDARAVAEAVARRQGMLAEMAREIWRRPELGLLEFEASDRQARALEGEGFSVRRGVGGMATALRAVWGQGGPVIAMLGEFDALPGLSQTDAPRREALEPGGSGHGCGHNLLGTAAVGAALALRDVLAARGLGGTVVYLGCPAEESVDAKAFMAADGALRDVDVAFYFHPGDATAASLSSCLATATATFTFRGTPAHAAADPERGRSALDAVELMNVGVNYLREHVPPDVRIHYTITDGGGAPNVVPERAASLYFVRAKSRAHVDQAYARVVDCARGAALMTGTEVDVRLVDGLWNILPNEVAARLLAEAMQLLGPVGFDADDRAWARAMAEHLPPGAREEAEARYRALGWAPGEGPDAALLMDESLGVVGRGEVGFYSTDAGDVSWIVPTGFLGVATAPVGTPGHSWQNVAAAGSGVGMKGMLYAAKAMALAGLGFVLEPGKVAAARAEFARATAQSPYRQVVEELVPPPHVPADAPWRA